MWHKMLVYGKCMVTHLFPVIGSNLKTNMSCDVDQAVHDTIFPCCHDTLDSLIDHLSQHKDNSLPPYSRSNCFDPSILMQ